MNGTSGQDREGYTDTQDRESYAVEGPGFTPGPWESTFAKVGRGAVGWSVYAANEGKSKDKEVALYIQAAIAKAKGE